MATLYKSLSDLPEDREEYLDPSLGSRRVFFLPSSKELVVSTRGGYRIAPARFKGCGDKAAHETNDRRFYRHHILRTFLPEEDDTLFRGESEQR